MNDIGPETQAVIDGIKIASLRDELERCVCLYNAALRKLEEQPCKFNCRTEKEAWEEGYKAACGRWIHLKNEVGLAYKEWKKNE